MLRCHPLSYLSFVAILLLVMMASSDYFDVSFFVCCGTFLFCVMCVDNSRDELSTREAEVCGIKAKSNVPRAKTR